MRWKQLGKEIQVRDPGVCRCVDVVGWGRHTSATCDVGLKLNTMDCIVGPLISESNYDVITRTYCYTVLLAIIQVVHSQDHMLPIYNTQISNIYFSKSSHYASPVSGVPKSFTNLPLLSTSNTHWSHGLNTIHLFMFAVSLRSCSLKYLTPPPPCAFASRIALV